jgi:hypothetical protein
MANAMAVRTRMNAQTFQSESGRRGGPGGEASTGPPP